MPRRARVVFENVPHHVTQRGVDRSNVFFERDDGAAYLALLRDYSERCRLEIVAYCLMPNHVHLVVVPTSADGLHRVLQPVHGLYARRINQGPTRLQGGRLRVVQRRKPLRRSRRSASWAQAAFHSLRGDRELVRLAFPRPARRVSNQAAPQYSTEPAMRIRRIRDEPGGAVGRTPQTAGARPPSTPD